eukprot:1014903-Pelagomonas_calceolata.AAC.4
MPLSDASTLSSGNGAGDVLIVGSHGLFDMVWLHGGPSTNLRRELYTLAYAGAEKTDPQLVAGQLIGLATNMATSTAHLWWLRMFVNLVQSRLTFCVHHAT